jgi:diguanylate cyclase (GGDEF)-like protein
VSPSKRAPDFDRLVTDPLTGVFGYHYFRLRLDEEHERALLYTRPLALVLVDLDDLRGVNDRFGRAAGDLALQQVAQVISGSARAVDRIGRWSGGSLAVLLPETGVGPAYGLAERLRTEVAARRFGELEVEGARQLGRLHVTVCCGVASLRQGRNLVARADDALWRAKTGGRNRSVVHG